MDKPEEASAIETIAHEVLPKIVYLLQEVAPEYRQRTMQAAMILVGESPPSATEKSHERYR